MNTIFYFLVTNFITFAVSAQAESLSVSEAKELSHEVFALAAEKGKCVSVAIVDPAAQLFYFERSPCAHLGSIETSIQKAKSSGLFRKPTSDFAAAVKSGKIGIVTADGVVAVEGGVPIYVKDKFAGAIGVGGATALEDEEFAKAAIDKLTKKRGEKK